MAKKVKRPGNKRLTPEQQEKRDTQIADIKARSEAGEISIAKGCHAYGLTYNQYYSHPFIQASKETKKKVKPNREMEIKQIVNLKSGKTLLIVTDDQSTIENVISTFTRS